MKIPARGRLLAGGRRRRGLASAPAAGKGPGTLTMREALHYVLSLPVSTVIVGCDSVAQVEENVAPRARVHPLSAAQMAAPRGEGEAGRSRRSSSAAGRSAIPRARPVAAAPEGSLTDPLAPFHLRPFRKVPMRAGPRLVPFQAGRSSSPGFSDAAYAVTTRCFATQAGSMSTPRPGRWGP